MKIHLGQRVEKSQDNKFGWIDKIQLSEIDRTKPLVICLPGSGAKHGRQANGMSKKVEELLGVADFAPEDKPCNIYGIYYDPTGGYGDDEKEREYFDATANGETPDISSLSPKVQGYIREIEDFAKQVVEGFFKPLVQKENGEFYEPVEIAKGFRNVHFVSYCFGSVVQSAINQELRRYLQSTGMGNELIEDLESQICVLQSAPFAAETRTRQTTVNFTSLDDLDTKNKTISANAIKQFSVQSDQNIIGGVVNSPNNNLTVFVKEFTTKIADDEHYSGFYFDYYDKWNTPGDQILIEDMVGGMLPVCTALCIRRAMRNAIRNSNSEKFEPLTMEVVTKEIDKYMDWAIYDPRLVPAELLNKSNANLHYLNAEKIETLEGGRHKKD